MDADTNKSTTPHYSAHPDQHGQHRRQEQHCQGDSDHKLNPYARFAAMILTSTAAMYALMYLNTYTWDHLFWSETRAYMALLMGACMAVIMLSFMWHMHRNTKINLGIYGGSVAVFALALFLVRSQTTVQDVS